MFNSEAKSNRDGVAGGGELCDLSRSECEATTCDVGADSDCTMSSSENSNTFCGAVLVFLALFSFDSSADFRFFDVVVIAAAADFRVGRFFVPLEPDGRRGVQLGT